MVNWLKTTLNPSWSTPELKRGQIIAYQLFNPSPHVISLTLTDNVPKYISDSKFSCLSNAKSDSELNNGYKLSPLVLHKRYIRIYYRSYFANVYIYHSDGFSSLINPYDFLFHECDPITRVSARYVLVCDRCQRTGHTWLPKPHGWLFWRDYPSGNRGTPTLCHSMRCATSHRLERPHTIHSFPSNGIIITDHIQTIKHIRYLYSNRNKKYKIIKTAIFVKYYARITHAKQTKLSAYSRLNEKTFGVLLIVIKRIEETLR